MLRKYQSDAHSGIKSAVLTDFNGIQLDNGDITSGRQYYFGSEGPAFYCLTVTDNMGNTAKKLFIVKIDSKGEVIPDNVVRIFNMFLDGKGYAGIAKTLQNEGILSPPKYRFYKAGKTEFAEKAREWHYSHVKEILQGEYRIA